MDRSRHTPRIQVREPCRKRFGRGFRWIGSQGVVYLVAIDDELSLNDRLGTRVGRRLYAGFMSWPRNLYPGPGGGLYTGAGGGMSVSRRDGASPLRGGGLSPLRGGGMSTLRDGGLSTLRGGGLSALRGGGLSTLRGGGLSTLSGGGLSTLRGGGLWDGPDDEPYMSNVLPWPIYVQELRNRGLSYYADLVSEARGLR